MDEVKLYPSHANIWVKCPGSVHAKSSLKIERTDDMDEGVTFHRNMEQLLRGEDADDEIFLPEGMGENLDKTMMFLVDYFSMTTEDLLTHKHMIVEKEVSLEEVTGGGKGFIDFIIRIGKTLYIFDWKYGNRIVSALDNKQLEIYACVLNTTLDSDVDKIVTGIIQPTRENYSFASYSRQALDDLTVWYSDAAKTARNPDAKRYAGDHCLLCDAQTTCQVSIDFMSEEAGIDFADLPENILTGNYDDTDLDKVVGALNVKPLILKWLDRIEQQAILHIQQGGVVIGAEISSGRKGNRFLVDGPKLEQLLGDKRHKGSKLISRSEAAKLMTSEQLDSVTDRHPPKTVLKVRDDVKYKANWDDF